MTIRVEEVGKELYVPTSFDLSSNTSVEINFTSPDESIKFTRIATAPGVNSPNLDGFGVLAANTYLLYLTQANDFTLGGAGAWCIEAVYNDTVTPKLFIGGPGTLVIADKC